MLSHAHLCMRSVLYIIYVYLHLALIAIVFIINLVYKGEKKELKNI